MKTQNALTFGPACLAMSLLLTAFGCDKDDKDNFIVPSPIVGTTLVDPAVVQTTISFPGTSYDSRCIKRGVLDLTSSVRSLVFDAGTGFSKTDNYFLGSSCGDAPALAFRATGRYDDSAKPIQVIGMTVNAIKFTIDAAFLTVKSEQLAVSLNTSQFCGKSDWALDQEVSILGLDCDGYKVNAGDSVDEIYAVEGDVLYFGERFKFAPVQKGAAETEAGVVPTGDSAVKVPEIRGVDRDVPYRVK